MLVHVSACVHAENVHMLHVIPRIGSLFDESLGNMTLRGWQMSHICLVIGNKPGA